MTLREYYNFQITEYFIRHNISYKKKSSKFSDYFYAFFAVPIPRLERFSIKSIASIAYLLFFTSGK